MLRDYSDHDICSPIFFLRFGISRPKVPTTSWSVGADGTPRTEFESHVGRISGLGGKKSPSLCSPQYMVLVDMDQGSGGSRLDEEPKSLPLNEIRVGSVSSPRSSFGISRGTKWSVSFHLSPHRSFSHRNL